MKTCFKCSRVLPRSAFYSHSAMADGLLGKCKECAKADVRRNRVSRRAQYSEYERARALEANRKKLVKEYQRNRRARHPHKDSARRAVDYALRVGKLRRMPCEVCGHLRSEAHHDDYAKALDVRWLCFRHHREVHGQTVVADRKSF